MKTIIIEGNTASVELTAGKWAVIDAADADLVKGTSWHALQTEPGRWYARSPQHGYMHRYLMGAKKGEYVDHKDGDGLNNRRSTNLRIVSNAQNMENRTRQANSNSKTGVRGVSVHKCKPSGLMYTASVQVKGKHKARFFPYTPEGFKRACEAVEEMRRELMTHSDGR